VADETPTTEPAVMDVFWRPGCPYCFSLRQALVRARIPVRWHNIWDDATDAAFVRSVADGNETVPTVVFSGKVMVNPSARTLLALVDEAQPELERHPSKQAARRAFKASRNTSPGHSPPG
jgi:glutaredoxin-like protein